MNKKLKNELLFCAVRSGVFAMIFGLVVACSNNYSTRPVQTVTGQRLIRLVSHLNPTMIALPSQLNSERPVLAGMFQTTSAQSSQLQQSFQGECGSLIGNQQAVQFNTPLNSSGAKTGFIPILVPLEPIIPVPLKNTQVNVCGSVFSQVGGGVDTVSGGTLTNPGIPVYLDGTLSTLVVTGFTVNNALIRCSDLTTTAQVHDQDLVQPYFVIDNNSVVLAIGTNQLPFTCNLNVPTGDQASYISVQWAKI